MESFQIKNKFLVSVIIPCRNEEKFIEKCLDSVLAQDYPKENLEIFVVDGASEDETKRVVEGYSKDHSFIKILDNPKKYTPFGLNIGIKASKGDIVIRMDAHAGYENNYISKCIEYLEKYKADNVGGVIKTLPANNTLVAKAIAAVLSSRFGAASSFRIGSKEPKWVDTVFGGCYKREVFNKIGYFNERMIRSQDIEFNKRLLSAGGKIILAPEIIATYYPQSTLTGFLLHNFEDGIWVTYPIKFGIKFFSTRHLLPMVFALAFLTAAILGIFIFPFRLLFDILFVFYFAINFLFSFKISLKIGLSALPYLMSAFFVRHFFYGLGSLIGLIKSKI
jgi:glycosyltransferase involved in cell wall biosynthesis